MSGYANKRRQGIFWRVRIRVGKVVCSVWKIAEVWHRTLFLKWWLLAGCSYSIWVFLQIFRFGAPMLGLWGSSLCIGVVLLRCS
uniref:Uncharacterized protein n=1 Tax=Lotus japonicus TaxID=34305 RepID=I3SPX8_LOTJA|nr:unknown [Lotus japonicus]